MKIHHLYPNPHGAHTDWRAVEGDNDSLNGWSASAAQSYDSIHFHPSEAVARAAAEPSVGPAMYKQDGKWWMTDFTHGQLMGRERRLKAVAVSALDDLRGCQRENERLGVELARLKATIADINSRSQP